MLTDAFEWSALLALLDRVLNESSTTVDVTLNGAVLRLYAQRVSVADRRKMLAAMVLAASRESARLHPEFTVRGAYIIIGHASMPGEIVAVRRESAPSLAISGTEQIDLRRIVL